MILDGLDLHFRKDTVAFMQSRRRRDETESS